MAPFDSTPLDTLHGFKIVKVSVSLRGSFHNCEETLGHN